VKNDEPSDCLDYAKHKIFAASVLKEKLASLGSSGILADHQLQAQLQEHHLKG
ncbi:hypothetical protein U1Q18_039324, partial [Sarracenia purpurea var. burkii]